jgi:hypothetical protein
MRSLLLYICCCYYCILVLLPLLRGVNAGLLSPLSSYAATSLYGTDCSEWCLNGSIVLQPSVFGSTNEYCTDARGCYWQWRMHIVPCSMSLLSFDAEVGNLGVLYSAIDSAASSTLGFYCGESDGGAVLELRSHSAAEIGSLMQWRYEQTDCVALLSNLASRSATFAGSNVAVQLGAQQWFGSGAQRLEALEVDCDAAAQQRALAECKQCFAGTQLAPLSRNASAQLTEACGFMAGDAASGEIKQCAVRWRFCYDVCADRDSDVAVRLGSGVDLKALQTHDRRPLAMRVGAPDDRGRTLFALTDADSVQQLDDGYATFYVLWEYREAPNAALWRASGRDALFVALHFAMVTANGEALSVLHQTGDIHALGAYAWDGSAPTGMDALVHAARTMTTQEAGLLAGLIVAVSCCVLGWSCALFLWFRHRWSSGSAVAAQHKGGSLLGGVQYTINAEQQQQHRDPSCVTVYRLRAEQEEAARQSAVAVAQRRVSDLRQQPNHSHLIMDTADSKLYDEQRAAELESAQRDFDAALAENGGRLATTLKGLPGATSLVTAVRSSGYEYRARTGQMA